MARMELVTSPHNHLKIAPKILVLSCLSITSIMVHAFSDGSIVPFATTLPACASNCGPLFDVQGKCVPPVTESVNVDCFCSDDRLKPFTQGTDEVSTVCGTASCTSEVDLQSIRTWYSTFCVNAGIGSEKGGGGSSSVDHSWLAGHARWVAMLVIIFILITGSWIAACVFRRRYLRRREKQNEMIDPVAWGPHQMQGATGGYGQNMSTHEKSRPSSKIFDCVAMSVSPMPAGRNTPIKET